MVPHLCWAQHFMVSAMKYNEVFHEFEKIISIYLFSGYDKNAELLIKNGADVNLANKNGATPIDIAAFNGKKPIECFNTENERNSA